MGWPLSDLTGIDINYHVNRTLESACERWKAIHPLTEATGCYGCRKTGSGHMDYSGPTPKAQPCAEVVWAFLQAHGAQSRNPAQRSLRLKAGCGHQRGCRGGDLRPALEGGFGHDLRHWFRPIAAAVTALRRPPAPLRPTASSWSRAAVRQPLQARSFRRQGGARPSK